MHHKTRPNGGSTRYGYPDTTYFNRVRQELALKGVLFENDEKKRIEVEEVTTGLSQIRVGLPDRNDFSNF